ncbi:MAG: hypothetical protein U0V56_07470 [Actinomycetota bacterium]
MLLVRTSRVRGVENVPAWGASCGVNTETSVPIALNALRRIGSTPYPWDPPVVDVPAV